jgi:DNA-binding transcriptional MerR regulator
VDKGFSIQFVSKITGVNPHTLRAWEKRYNAITPKRDDNGRRLYFQEDIDKLKLLFKLCNLGNPISDIANLNIDELSSIHNRAFGGKSIARTTAPAESIDYHSMLQKLILALQFYKLDVISHELDKVKNNVSVREFSLNVLVPLLQEVGAMCSTGMLSIAQEHALSAILKFHVGKILYDYAEESTNIDLPILIAAPDGEMHEFGILIAALLCKHYGIKFYYLGNNLPAESLSQCANQINAKLIILGISKNMESKHPQHVIKYVEDLHGQLKNTPIMLGGFSQTPQNLRALGIEFIPTLNMLDLKLSQLKV